MTFKTIAGLSLFLFAASMTFLFALTIQQSWQFHRPIQTKYALQDVRLLSAEEINRRTLTLADEINASAK